MINGINKQLTLSLEVQSSYDLDDFMVSSCNEEAIQWLEKYSEWPAPALIIYGSSGCGKTHLAHVFANGDFSGETCPIINGTDFTIEIEPPEFIGSAQCVVLDDADKCKDEPALFHLYNYIKETGRHMLLTSTEPPSKWGTKLADLRSRMLAGLAIGIGEPDDVQMAAVIVKLFSDRQIRIDQDVVAFLLSHMERSFAEACRVIAEADELSLSTKRKITIPLIKKVL
ncbi:MAG: DNA replication protein [Alphaproteobacteria bacterium]|nr:DNA replication protein [Alphaproteobacteria bacterium]